MRKGRCSNDPRNCTLAGNATELPYAGVDSVCPECGSPLAAIAATPKPPPPPYVQAPSPSYTPPSNAPIFSGDQPAYTAQEAQKTYRQSSGYQELETSEQAPNDSALKLTQIAIVGAAIVLIGFFAWRMFLQPRPVSAPDLAATASVTGVGTQQVTQISPAQMRRINVATEARGVPDAAGSIVAQLAAGSVLDITGQIQVGGVTWLRVSLPNDSSKSGFVREDQMTNLGDGALAISPMDPMSSPPAAGTTAASMPSPEVVGPIQARDPSTLYIASVQANIRLEANASSTKVGAFEFTDPITVVGQRSVGTGLWYQVQLPSGGTGWINARLVSASPRDIPLDRESASLPPKASIKSKPTSQPNSSSEDMVPLDSKPSLTAVDPGTTMRVDASIANLRKEPGAIGNSVIEVLQRDTLMSVEDVRILSGVPWYRVTSPNGAQGWVSGRNLVPNQ